MKLIQTRHHPHPTCQRMLQEYDDRLWLVWIRKFRRWAVVYRSPTPVRTHRHLQHQPGVAWPMDYWELATMVWGNKREYLAPDSCPQLILDAVRKNSVPIDKQIEAIDGRHDERHAQLDEEHSESRLEAMQRVMDTVGTSKTVVGFGKNDGVRIDYARDARGRRVVTDESGNKRFISQREFEQSMERAVTKGV